MRTLCGKGTQDPLAKISSLVWKPLFPDLQRWSSSFLGERECQILLPGYPPSRRRSFPWLELVAIGSRFRPHYSPPLSSFEGSGQGASSSTFSSTRFSKPSGRGVNTESSSPLLASPGQRVIFQNDVMINERRCVRLEDYLLGRQCGCCSGPRPR